MEGRLCRDAEKASTRTTSVPGRDPRPDSPVRRLSGPQRRWPPRPQGTLDWTAAHSRFRSRYSGARGHSLDVYKRMGWRPGLDAAATSWLVLPRTEGPDPGRVGAPVGARQGLHPPGAETGVERQAPPAAGLAPLARSVAPSGLGGFGCLFYPGLAPGATCRRHFVAGVAGAGSADFGAAPRPPARLAGLRLGLEGRPGTFRLRAVHERL